MKSIVLGYVFLTFCSFLLSQKTLDEFPSVRENISLFMEQKWKTEAKSGRYPPYVKNNIIFPAASDEFAIDGNTGRKLLFNNPEHQEYLRQALKNDSILHLYSQYMYRCINVFNGKLLYRNHPKRNIIFASPKLSSDSLIAYQKDGTNLASFNLKTGKYNWQFESSSPIPGEFITIQDRKVYCSNKEYFFKFDLATGDLDWKFSIKNTVLTQPKIIENIAYLNILDEGLYALDMEKQEIVWFFKVDNLTFGGEFIVDDDAIYIPYWTLYAINRHNGQLIWKTNNETRWYSYDKAYIATTRNYVIAEFEYDNTMGLAAINKKTGKIEYWAKSFYRFYPIRFENQIYGCDFDFIYGFDLLVE